MHKLEIEGYDVRDMAMACLKFCNYVLHNCHIREIESITSPSGPVVMKFDRYYEKADFPVIRGLEDVEREMKPPVGEIISEPVKPPRRYKMKVCTKCNKKFRPHASRQKLCDKCTPKAEKIRRATVLNRRLKYESSQASTEWFHGIKGIPNWPIEKIAALPSFAQSKFVAHMTQAEKRRLNRLLSKTASDQLKNSKLDRLCQMLDNNADTKKSDDR